MMSMAGFSFAMTYWLLACTKTDPCSPVGPFIAGYLCLLGILILGWEMSQTEWTPDKMFRYLISFQKGTLLTFPYLYATSLLKEWKPNGLLA